jgi:predicted kinase
MKNKKIILTIAIPAAGKTTWRKKFLRENPNYVCVSRDEYRLMLRNAQTCEFKMEQYITELVEDAIVRAIKNKFNVIVDQTNVNLKWLKPLVEFCEKLADVEFKIFDVGLEECIRRDNNREMKVGEEVIRRMYKNYLELFNSNFDFSPRKKKPYIAQGIKWKRNGNLPDAVIFDIDGTLAHMQGMRGTFDWHRVGVDAVDEKLRETVRVYDKAGYNIIVVTGRDGLSEEKTKQWFRDNKIPFHRLFTKPKNDFRKDSITKTEIFNEHIKGKFNVLCAYDDRDQAVAMWRGLGVKCYQVAEGTF